MDLKKYANLQSIAFEHAIYISDVGYPGVEYPIGTSPWPVLGGGAGVGFIEARVIATARNQHVFFCRGVLQIDAAMEDYVFQGHYFESLSQYIDLNGQDVDCSRFHDLVITGAQGGTGLATFTQCILWAMTGFKGLAENCPIYGTLALAAANFADFDGCSSVHNVCVITVGTPTRASFKDFKGNLTLTAQTAGVAFVRGFDGDLIIDAMTGGTLDIFMRDGTVTINANCTGGTINIYGSAIVTDNSVGAIVTDATLDERAANINDQTSGILVQVPYFVAMDTIVGGTITLFQFDALGCTIRDVLISFYLPLDVAATLTPTWEKTRAGDLVTFTAEAVPALANIVTPGANNVYRYHLGEVAQGLQGRFRIAQVGGAIKAVDAFAVVVMEL